MFKQLKNIDTVARLQRLFNIVLMLVTAVVLCFGIYKSYDFADKAQNKVHILYNGKVLAAFTSDRKTNLPVELRDHIKTFHEDFFTLAPDDGQIDTAIRKALYLSDNSAKRVYDNLKEANYFNNLISGNINQQITVDSIRLDMNAYPWAFTCFATEKLIRASSTITRRLVTTGKVSDLKTETDRNPHGFLIQGWEILVNNDIPQSK